MSGVYEKSEDVIEKEVGEIIGEEENGDLEVCDLHAEEEIEDQHVVVNEGAETVGASMPMPLRGFSLFVVLSLPFAIWTLGLGG